MNAARVTHQRSPDIELLLGELQRCCDLLASASAESVLDSQVREAHDTMAAILSVSSRSKQGKALLRFPGLQALSERLGTVNAAYHRCAELAKARAYLSQANSSADPFENSWLSPGFDRLLRGQVARWRRLGLFARADARPIVIVGGGALPQSQVFLHRATGHPVISIEKDAESALVAREVLTRLGYHRNLEVIHADGCHYDYADALIVVVATLVAEKANLAETVARTASDTFLNVRSPTGLHRLWRVPFETGDLQRGNWSIIDGWTPRAASVRSTTCAKESDR